jgi:hypothetical protein
MQIRGALFLISIFLAFSASADDTTTNMSQWRHIGSTMDSLIADGAKVVSVLNEQTGDSAIQTFYLQSDRSFFKCNQVDITDLKAKKSSGFFMCWQLVSPYKFTLPQK